MPAAERQPEPPEAQSGPPEFPDLLDYPWDWFLELSLGLKANGMGPLTASWTDVQDWAAAMQLELEPWEKRTLIMLSALRADILSEEEAVPGQ